MDEAGRGQPSVLLVDDDAENLEALRESLGSQGLRVIGQADDGPGGVAMALELVPDVVLMDLRMPGGMDGFDATRAIVEARPDIQVVILTAYEELLTSSADEVGAFAYLVKGCSSELMRDVIVQAWQRGIDVRRELRRI